MSESMALALVVAAVFTVPLVAAAAAPAALRRLLMLGAVLAVAFWVFSSVNAIIHNKGHEFPDGFYVLWWASTAASLYGAWVAGSLLGRALSRRRIRG